MQRRADSETLIPECGHSGREWVSLPWRLEKPRCMDSDCRWYEAPEMPLAREKEVAKFHPQLLPFFSAPQKEPE